MSFPHNFIDDLKSRVLLSQLVGTRVSWDMKKTNTGKGDYWAPCPFHQEKTASFHVDDQKGYYYCFGCHAKGNHFSFMQEIDNINFMQSVEKLAGIAGVPMPANTPEAKEKYDRAQTLLDIMEQAVNFFKLQLKTNAGAAARTYIEQRGLTDDTITAFDIGFAPTGKALFQHLRDKNHAHTDIIACGLAIQPDDQPNDPNAGFDRFRNRIMFPIRNSAGRCIAFGGRAMDENAPAKYLNSPETDLFDKGRTLYNFAPARTAAGKAGRLIVTEGYMDVLALSQHGFTDALAPLGTAISPYQLGLMWQIQPEPIIALDGDTAGLRAAHRVIDIALPILKAGQSLRFALLPEGLDPDDVLKTGGAAAMNRILQNATPLVDFLWNREIGGKTFDTPEKRAVLDGRINMLIGQINDSSLQFHYKTMLNQRKSELFFTSREKKWGGKKTAGKATMAAKNSPLATAGKDAVIHNNISIILCAALLNPHAAAAVEATLELVQIPAKFTNLEKIHAALLRNLHDCLSVNNPSEALLTAIKTQTGEDPMQTLLQPKPLRINPDLRPDADPQKLERLLGDTLNRHLAEIGLHQEIADSIELGEDARDENTTWRLQEAIKNKEKTAQIPNDFSAQISEAEEEASNYLDNIQKKQIWVKKKR